MLQHVSDEGILALRRNKGFGDGDARQQNTACGCECCTARGCARVGVVAAANMGCCEHAVAAPAERQVAHRPRWCVCMCCWMLCSSAARAQVLITPLGLACC